jgi:hypothetical protein
MIRKIDNKLRILTLKDKEYGRENKGSSL